MSITPIKLIPDISLPASPALIPNAIKGKTRKLVYGGILRNEMKLGEEKPAVIDLEFRLVVNGENKTPKAFYLRGNSEKIKLTFKPDGSPDVIFHSGGPQDGTLENGTKTVIRGKVRQKTLEHVGQYQYCNPFQFRFFSVQDGKKVWVNTKRIEKYLDDNGKENLGIQLMGMNSFVDIALEGTRLCLEEVNGNQ